MPKCSLCDGETDQNAVMAEVWEAIDGDQNNLLASNLRNTGKIQHECFACLQRQALDYPPIIIVHKRFREGYEAGRAQVKQETDIFLSSMSDEEIILRLKKTFAEYVLERNEDVLYHEIGGIIGQVIELTTLPVVNTRNSMKSA